MKKSKKNMSDSIVLSTDEYDCLMVSMFNAGLYLGQSHQASQLLYGFQSMYKDILPDKRAQVNLFSEMFHVIKDVLAGDIRDSLKDSLCFPFAVAVCEKAKEDSGSTKIELVEVK